jgi:hypothetical protein
MSVASRIDEAAHWYRDPHALRFLVAGYLPWLAVLNLSWETAHLPLYTIWTEALPAEIAFAVAHCTLGDLLIGIVAIGVALIATRAPALARWNWPRIAMLTALTGAAYTALSEWMNVVALRSWEYSASMPTLQLGEFGLGLSPIGQWLAIPPAALWLAVNGRRNAARIKYGTR